MRRWLLGAAVAGCAAVPPAVLHAALAAAAGTLFEAAPFVLAMTLVRTAWARRLSVLLGCGCGSRAGPAALSLPATGLCWLTFGPGVALARFGAALLLEVSGAFGRPQRDGRRHGIEDPMAELTTIGAAAFALGVVTAVLQSGFRLPWDVAAGIATPLEVIAGVAAGWLAPCSTAAIAMAAMLRGPAPFAAAGMLATAGLIPVLPRGRHNATAPNAVQSSSASMALVGLACFVLAVRGGAGFVHPRLVPLLWFGVAVAALVSPRRPVTQSRYAVAVPAAMIASLVLGSPLPSAQAVTSTLDDVYPGEPIAFTGATLDRPGTTALVRYAITCCRADATAIIVPVDRSLPVAPNSWVALRGTIAYGATGAYVRVRSWHNVPRPSDPYLYL